ncbi:secreted antigen 1 [Babesia caballi]|uniref:Secreted antigen 1 n=1 Tax=Babesia caballi TaxID=5871 RepID=A0AAV4LQ47_BABCB|nr:secreted antigen 1 [Babesia caballi]
MSHNCQEVYDPDTLKKALEFLGELHRNTQASTQLASKIKKRVAKYLNCDLFAENKYDLQHSINNLLQQANELRTRIITSKKLEEYNRGRIIGDDGADHCVISFIDLLPKLHSTLQYLYFHVDTNFLGSDDGHWKKLHFDGVNDIGDLKYLNRWLMGKYPGTPSTDGSNCYLLPGGYDANDLSHKKGASLKSYLWSIIDGYDGDGYIPNLLLALSFDLTYTTITTAVALVFVTAFCTAVRDGVFDYGMYESRYRGLTVVCTNLLSTLKPLTPDDVDFRESLLVALYSGSVEYFKGMLQSKYFDNYVNWLKKWLKTLILCLGQMQNDCKKWDPYVLQTGSTAGPFAYGFLFGGKWNTEPWDTREDHLPGAIKKLTKPDSTSSLNSLIKCLGMKEVEEEKIYKKYAQRKGDEFKVSEKISRSESEVASASVTGPGEGYATVHPAGIPIQNNSNHEGHSALPPVGTGSRNAPQSPTESSQGAHGSHSEEDKSQLGAGHHQSISQDVGWNGKEAETADGVNTDGDGDHDSSRQLGSSGVFGDPKSDDTDARVAQSGTSTLTIGGAAGGVALFAGGGVALYFLNIGGIKTLITGIP